MKKRVFCIFGAMLVVLMFVSVPLISSAYINPSEWESVDTVSIDTDTMPTSGTYLLARYSSPVGSVLYAHLHVSNFAGDLSIDSDIDDGTTVSIYVTFNNNDVVFNVFTSLDDNVPYDSGSYPRSDLFGLISLSLISPKDQSVASVSPSFWASDLPWLTIGVGTRWTSDETSIFTELRSTISHFVFGDDFSNVPFGTGWVDMISTILCIILFLLPFLIVWFIIRLVL